jgi:hypothetical protein
MNITGNVWGDDEPVIAQAPVNAPNEPQPEIASIGSNTNPYVANDVGMMNAQNELMQSHTVAGDAHSKEKTSEQLESTIKQRVSEIMAGSSGLRGQAAIDAAMQGIQVPPGYEKVAQQMAEQAELQNRDARDMMNMTPSGQSMGEEKEGGSKGFLAGLGALGGLGGLLAGLSGDVREKVDQVVEKLSTAFKGKDVNIQDFSLANLGLISPSQTPVAAMPTQQLSQTSGFGGRALNA